METLAAQPPQEQFSLNPELRVRTDTITWLAEALDGSMRTSFEFWFYGQEFYGEDGGGLTDIFDDSIREAKTLADEDPDMSFELRRRLIERGELDDMKDLASGKLLDDDGQQANTIIVVSDFPAELMNSPEDVGGYNVGRKQTMLRVITLERGGKVRLTTQSLDGSNRKALEAIYHALGRQPEPGELLSQRVHCSLSDKRQSQLADNLTQVYDDSLRLQHGGEWHAGRRPADYRNTYEFARSQSDLVDWFTAHKLADPIGAERLRFKIAATAAERFERAPEDLAVPKITLGTIATEALVSVRGIHDQDDGLLAEMAQAERRATKLGKTFSGCGASIRAETTDEELTTAERVSSLGYGNKAGQDRYGSLRFKCPNGHENVRPRGKLLSNCKTCGCSVKC